MTKYPDAGFAVISDLHFYDTSLGYEGAAFEKELSLDRKMLAESEELLDYMIKDLLKSNIKFLLVCGDLTKDGEALNHEKLSAKLQILVNYGIKVIVTPGNHDINNYSAAEFLGNVKSIVNSVSAEDFKKIYAEMGYGCSLMNDSSSLSYVSEPVPGLWVVAIDSCRYDENKANGIPSVVGGMIKAGTEQWLSNVLSEAKKNYKAVIALMHHGIIEHWNGQSRLYPDSLIKNHNHIANLLVSSNVGFVFTGHNHAQSIVEADFSGKRLCDVGTGSLVTYPCPIRFCNLNDSKLTINTKTIADKLRPGTNFSNVAKNVLKKAMAVASIGDLLKYRISDVDAEYIANVLGEAFAAHYSGDADIRLRPAFQSDKLSLWGKIIFAIQQRYVIDPLWESVSPRNNNASIALNPEFASEKYRTDKRFATMAKKSAA